MNNKLKIKIIFISFLTFSVIGIVYIVKLFAGVYSQVSDEPECKQYLTGKVYFDPCYNTLLLHIDDGLFRVISSGVIEQPVIREENILTYKRNDTFVEVDIDTLR